MYSIFIEDNYLLKDICMFNFFLKKDSSHLEAEMGNNLVRIIYHEMINSGINKTCEDVVSLLEGSIPKRYIHILKNYGVELIDHKSFLKINRNSLCIGREDSPLKIALQIFYITLHTDLKVEDLDFLDMNLEENNKEIIVNNIIMLGVSKLGLNEFNDEELLEYNLKKTKIIGLKKIETIYKNNTLKKIFDEYQDENSIKFIKSSNLFKFLDLIEGVNELQFVLDYQYLNKILESWDDFLELEYEISSFKYGDKDEKTVFLSAINKFLNKKKEKYNEEPKKK